MVAELLHDKEELTRELKAARMRMTARDAAPGEGAAAALNAMVGVDGATALQQAVEAAAGGDLAAVVDPLLEALSAIRELQVGHVRA